MKSVVPATNSLLSMLPAWNQGGTLLIRPRLSGGATPMLPKNGRSGISMPAENRAIILSRSSGMILVRAYGNSSGESGAGPEGIVRVRNGKLYGSNAHLQRVARLGAFHIDGPCQDMAARPLVGDFAVNVAQSGLDIGGGGPPRVPPRPAICGERFHTGRNAPREGP